MPPATELPPRDVIITVVVDLLASGGDDAVRLREVARRAHVSLATIYKLFATREDLVLAALEQWRETTVYAGLDPVPGESTHDGLMRVFRLMFEPWERHPLMLDAFLAAQRSPHGSRLTPDGTAVVGPAMRALFDGEDPDRVEDILITLDHVVRGVVGRFTDGTIAVTDILPEIERAVTLLSPAGPRPTRRSR